jgi:Fe2+ or Zn2+ uptake regulation protein
MDRRQIQNSLQHSSEVVKAQHVYFEMVQKGQRTTRKSP